MLDEILAALLLFAAALVLCAIIIPLMLVGVFLLAYIITYPPRFTTCLAATSTAAEQQRLRSNSGSLSHATGNSHRNSTASAGQVFVYGTELQVDCGMPLEHGPLLWEEEIVAVEPGVPL